MSQSSGKKERRVVIIIKQQDFHFLLLTLRTILARPFAVANAGLRLQIELSVGGAVGEALEGLVVRLTAIRGAPPLLADAGSIHANPVIVAGWMRAVDWRGSKLRIN